MEYERLSESVLREEIALLREHESRLKQNLGRLENERRRREAEYIALRSEAILNARMDDDFE